MAPARLLAVDVFLSIIAITSKQLVGYMRNIWKVRGNMETNQFADQHFLIEFSEEGYFEHVICGGPWRYKDDAVLVRKLKEGEDPETTQFESVPIWVQYKNIPFYLLTKALARDLAARTGKFIYIDNNARGDLNDKILRARVWMPFGCPLLRGIPIEDELTDEEVMVSLRYERLPNFCLFYGIVGHNKQNCDGPEMPKPSRYNPSLSVPPTSRHDLRSWPLPEKMGQRSRTPSHSLPWRSGWEGGNEKMKKSGPQHTAIVAHVAKKVEKMSMQDKENPRKIANGSIMIYPNNNKNTNDKEGARNQDTTTYTKAAINNTDKEINNTNKLRAANSSATAPAKRVSWEQLQHALDMAAVASRDKVPEGGAKRNEEERKQGKGVGKVDSLPLAAPEPLI
ncbi:hypothetical protein ACQ4PT_016219 [Festuca glaucescens]